MALVYPNANGNWSTVANWYSGGVPYGQLPQPTDTVDLGARIVLLDTNVSVVSITGTNVNGYLNVTGGNYTINGNIYATAGYQNVIISTLPSGTSLTINGNIYQQGTNGTIPQNAVINHNGLGTINVTGNIYALTSGNVSIAAIINQNVGTININGTVTNGSGSARGVANYSTGTIIFQGSCITTFPSAACILNYTTGTIIVNGGLTPAGGSTVEGIAGGIGILTINGDCLGALSSAPTISLCASIGNGTMTINGNVTARNHSPSTTAGIVYIGGNGTINVNGNVTGGSVANTIAISSTSTGTINISGSATGGSHATNTPAIYNTSTGTINVSGSTVANAYPAIWSTNTGAKFNLLGDITNVGSTVAYYGSLIVKISPSNAQQFTYQDANNVNRVIATSNITAGAPIPANVRLGVVYGSLSQYTGTLAMASPSNVRNGVATDNTVGTADLTAEDIFNEIGSSSNTIAVRLRNVSTVETMGDQLASYQV